ncbi:multicopper oxidase [Aureococcus anophagefferens]|nr:multicopper oxidase [Aureococcus anophagefferens]
MRPALARGVAAAAVILAVVVALMTLSYVRVDSTTPFARRYGLRQAPLRRSRGGALRTRLRVGAGPDAFGVVSGATAVDAGPTLVVAPGDAVTVEVVNGLGAEDGAARARDSLRRPNTTSLHMHGWHASPRVSPREDDVFSLVAPGESKRYDYHLPADHAPGTYWYHPHAQGSSGLQAYGMLGAVVVADADPGRFPEDVVMLLASTNLVAGKARNYAWASVASGSRLPVVAGGAVGADATKAAAALRTSCGRPSTRASSRSTASSGPRSARPRARGSAGAWSTAGRTTSCRWSCRTRRPAASVVARDGVALPEPRPAFAAPLVLAPGSRVDLFAARARHAPRSATLAYYLGAGSDVFDGEILDVVPTPSRRPDASAAPRLDAPPPRLFASLLGERPDRVATLAYYDGEAVVRDGNAYTDYGLRVVDGDGAVEVGDVVEWTPVWTVRNDVKRGGPEDTNHPFHLHTNHFQIVDLSHGEGVDYAVGQWRDTITVPTPGWVKIRFRAADYDGPSLAHCHIFSHSDLGMQHKFDIGTGAG